MSYLVLARKWRPQTFDDIVSQEYVTLSLKNAVSTGKIAHAFIFSGPRGVGKTSTARILAKALNCASGPTPEPCSECAFCREIAEGKSLDVIEIDAASHTGVNDVREIIENVKYLPTSGKYKIYIIDEAHMLSQSAFNALLKTLEEPPPHVLFILATTEAHKIPATILSRCQRYDFRKVPAEKIKENLAAITSSEGIKVADETLYTVAQEADGSMRDALSLMDQLLATFGSDIAHDDALRILGVLDSSLLKSAAAGIMDKDPKACIEALNRAVEKGINPKRFAEDLLRTLRYALLIKTCGKDTVPELSDEDKNEIAGITSGESVETLESLFSFMLDGAENIQRSFYPQMALEFTLIKLATLERTVPLESIIKRLEMLSGALKTGGEPRSRFDEPRGNYEKRQDAPEETPKTHGPVKESSTREQDAPAGDKGPVIKYIKSRNVPMATRLEQAKSISAEGSVFKITFGNPIHTSHFKKKETETELKKFLREYFNRDMDVEIAEDAPTRDGGAAGGRNERSENKKKIQNDPALKDAIEIFGGRVVSVKPRQKE
ncbi:MAG TPA: DNA polymerase III subunit gamma/tau [Thermodesulfobacteriota bacterium]|nr:DNA polymerase III subunit gamma/tau [Thermodesulfobacteriota bacterium]